MTATMAPEGAPATATKNAKRASVAVKMVVSGEPTVQLLPPAVRDRAIARSRMRTGVLFVILGVLVVFGMVAMTSLRAQQAQQALADANARTQDLISQQAAYSDAVNLDRLITQAQQLQLAATETEVSWGDLVMTLVSMLPAEAYIQDVNLGGAVPWKDPIADLGDPELDPKVVAVVNISLSTMTIQDATNYTRALSALKGYGTAIVSTVAVGTDGRVASSIRLYLTTDAASGRFASKAAGETDDSEGTAPADETETDDAATDDVATTEEEN